MAICETPGRKRARPTATIASLRLRRARHRRRADRDSTRGETDTNETDTASNGEIAKPSLPVRRAQPRQVVPSPAYAQPVSNRSGNSPPAQPEQAHETLPRSRLNSFPVTPFGLQIAMFFSRTYSRLLQTGLAEICDPIPINTPLRRHFDRLDQAIGDHVDQLNLAA